MTITQLLIIAGVLFNVGGFFWLARNHFTTINKRLDSHAEALRDLRTAVARIEGRLT